MENRKATDSPESDRSPALRMARLSIDAGTAPLLPPSLLQASQAPSTSSEPTAPSTSATNTPSSSSRRPRQTTRKFICNYPDCGKTFTTYRNHIVRNARRRKKAFASAMAAGAAPGLPGSSSSSKDIYGGDLSPSSAPIPLLSTGGRISIYPPSSSSASASTSSSEPIFVHSSYSTLSHLGGPTRLSAAAIAAASSSSTAASTSTSTATTHAVAGPSSSSSGSRAGQSIASRRGQQQSSSTASSSAAASRSASTPRSRASHLHLGSLDRSKLGGQESRTSNLAHTPSAVVAPPPSSYLSPPLASPSVMDRPHTATTTSFFLASMGPLASESGPSASVTGSEGNNVNNPGGNAGMTIHPPPLMHRHSYSALGSQPVLEPITPMSELPSYPIVYHTHPHAGGHYQYEQQPQHQQYHQNQHNPAQYHQQFPHSPGYPMSPYPLSPDLDSTSALQGGIPYSPTLSAAGTTIISASPRLLDGSLPTPAHELHAQQQAGYFQLSTSTSSSTGSEGYYTGERYGNQSSHSSANVTPSHHFDPSLSHSQQRQHAGSPMPSASYPPNYPQSGSMPPSNYLLHPHHATSTPIPGTAAPINTRTVISHSSLGSHNPLLSGLGLAGDEDLTTVTRSSNLSTSGGGGGNGGHLAPVSENDSMQSEGGHYTTSAPPGIAAPSSMVPARWLRSPSSGSEYASLPGQAQGGPLYGQMDGSWQPEFGTASSHIHASSHHHHQSNVDPSTATSSSSNQGSVAPSAVSAPSSVVADQTLSIADPDERAYRQAILEDPAFGFHESATW
ncbi:hypothetical protein P389DRAFT_194885 [Cystobasidium minutum MCA 4210]|uniref:uncharacterized protein n=1 Tax=Cystobasidium minutum MCA 4210 TaxID=1397322 RepID=UPI0034D00C8C|eukprot:jgi/Rhomi1/194885/gm1.3099_g